MVVWPEPREKDAVTRPALSHTEIKSLADVIHFLPAQTKRPRLESVLTRKLKFSLHPDILWTKTKSLLQLLLFSFTNYTYLLIILGCVNLRYESPMNFGA